MSLSRADRQLPERSSARFTATITDETGAAIAAAQLTTLTLTLYDRDTGEILNSRDRQNVLNAANVTVDADGLLTWSIQPADNVLKNTALPTGRYETHIGLFEWTWGSGQAGSYELLLEVRQLSKVPAT